MKIRYLLIMILTSSILLSSCSLLHPGKPLTSSDLKLNDSLDKCNEEGVREALEEGANPDNLDGNNPLYIAMLHNYSEIVEILLGNGADPNYLDNYELTPLMHAAGAMKYTSVNRTGIVRLENCQMLVENGADVNLVGRKGNTALEYAVLYGREGIVNYLLDNGARIRSETLAAVRDGYDGEGYIRYGLQNTILKGLLATGKESGLDSLLEAAILGDVSKETELIQAGKLKDKYATEILFNTVAFGDLDTLKLLEKQGLSITELDTEEISLLQIAAEFGQMDIVKYIFDKGADIEAMTLNGETPLIYAVKNNHYDVVKYLLDQGAKIYHEKNGAFSSSDALDPAAQNGNIEMIQLIESYDENISEERTLNAVGTGIANDHTNVLEYYLNKGVDVNLAGGAGMTILCFSCADHYEAVKILVERGADVNKDNPITQAAEYGSPEIVAYLIEHGADVNASGVGGLSAMDAAVNRGSLEMVKILVENGAKFENEKGYSYLLSATSETSWRVLAYLIGQGADINVKDNNGETPLILAAYGENTQFVELLLNAGANPNIEDTAGKTALAYAKENNNQEIIKLLEAAQ